MQIMNGHQKFQQYDLADTHGVLTLKGAALPGVYELFFLSDGISKLSRIN